jgi:hypothetical protein
LARKPAAPMGVRLARWKVRLPDGLSASGGHVEHPDRRAAGKVEMGQRETPDRPLPLEKDAGGETEVRDTTPH